MVAVGVWPDPWAPLGRRGGVAIPLGPAWPPWGRGQSPGFHMAAVGAWLVPWTPYSRRGGVSGPPGLVLSPWSVASCLDPVWSPWECGRSTGHRMTAVGRGRSPGPVWPPWGRGRSPGPRTAAMGAWPVPWSQHGRRGGVAGPLVPVCPPWGRGWSPGSRWPPLGRGRSRGPLMAAVGAWSVPWSPYGRRGGVAGPLDHDGCRVA